MSFAYNLCKFEGKGYCKENVRLCMGKKRRFMIILAPSLRRHININNNYWNISQSYQVVTEMILSVKFSFGNILNLA